MRERVLRRYHHITNESLVKKKMFEENFIKKITSATTVKLDSRSLAAKSACLALALQMLFLNDATPASAWLVFLLVFGPIEFLGCQSQCGSQDETAIRFQ